MNFKTAMYKKLLSPIGCIFLTILLISIFSVNKNLFSQTNPNWITPNKTYLKMYVVDKGMSRIERSDFVNAGINTTGLDPRTVKVYNRGSQIPIYFSGEQDGVFNDNDFFDFYGDRNYGGLVKTYDSNNNVLYVTNEYYNQYSDTNVYWVDWGGANGLRFQNLNYSVSNLYPNNYFTDKIHFEKDKLYYQGENSSATDYRFLSTEKVLGEGWYWELMYNTQILTDTFSAPVQSTSPQSSSIKLFAIPRTRNTSVMDEHSLEVRINGTLISTLLSNDFNKIDTTVSFSSSLLSSSNVNTVSVKYTHQPGFTGSMYFDNFEISYPRKFLQTNKKLSAQINSADSVSKVFSVSGYSNSSPVYIYDVLNNIRLTNFTTIADTLKFSAKGISNIQISNDTIRNKPVKIKQRQVKDLVSTTNGADYLVIYNSIFESQAEQLRAYRNSHDGYRSFKAEVEDIYDVFGYGIEDPLAVRYFTNYVNENWQLPKLRFICLFGRGSLDPKKNSTGSVYYKNLVPVYGNPNADGYFGNFNFGTFFYYPQVAIGRLPAYSAAEAQIMVDKIIAYESQPFENWNKNFTFITNGSTPAEQNSHQVKSNFDCAVYVSSPPVSGYCTKIYRNDTSGGITYNYADSIVKDFDEGTIFVNYRGHAGSHDWEVMMQDPNTLNNGSKLPLVISLTCFTGETAKPDFRAFLEMFMYLPNKGAIGTIGTTGWSFSTNGNDFGSYLLQTFKIDTTRIIGDIVKFAGKSMSRDSLSFSIRHTINGYTLSGDPAVTLKYPKTADFKITQSDYKLEPKTVTLNTPASLTIKPYNLGMHADSVKIRFQLVKNNLNYSFRDTVIKAFTIDREITHNFTIDTIGIYSMNVILDVDNRFPLENPNDNSIQINIPLLESSFIPIRPADNSVIFKDSVQFVILNPNFDYGQSSVNIYAEMDTSKYFNSPVKKTFTNLNIKGGSTIFNTSIPVLNNNTLYYWRSRSIINTDTSGWSQSNNFIYNNGIGFDSPKMRPNQENLPVVISKSNKDQFDISELNNTVYSDGGIRLNEEDAVLYVRSYGSNAEEASYFSVGSKNIFIDGGKNTGLNFLKVNKLTGKILDFKNLKMNTASSSDSMITFLNTFDTAQYLMLLNAAYFAGGDTLTPGGRAKLREFGSVYADTIGLLGYFHSWAFIGFRGAHPSQATEMFDACCQPVSTCRDCSHWLEAVVSMNVKFKKSSGTVTNIIGPASTWTDFSWNADIFPNSSIGFDVIGIDRNGAETMLRPNVQTSEFNELGSISAEQYPKLKFNALLDMDTLSGFQSPVLRSLKVKYSAASELVFVKNSLQYGTSDKDKNAVNFSFDFTNSGYKYLFGTVVNLYSKSISGSNLISSDTVTQLLKTDSSLTYSNSFTKPGFRDSSRIWIEIIPKDGLNEFYTFNNSGSIPLTSSSETVKNEVKILADGKLIQDGESVRKDPEIRIELTGERNTGIMQDTSMLIINLNGYKIPYYLKGNLNPALKTIELDNQTGSGNIAVLLKTVLNSGSNRLGIRYLNERGSTDSLYMDLIVSDETGITGVYNFPNPMKNETAFIFDLKSPDIIPGVRIKIYTVQGRLIRKLNVHPNIGVNQIIWDGRDDDGDNIANGTYLYKIFTDGNIITETAVQKLVMLR